MPSEGLGHSSFSKGAAVEGAGIVGRIVGGRVGVTGCSVVGGNEAVPNS